MRSRRLGVGGQAEIGYRAMLTRSRWQPEDLARALGWPLERVTAVLAELCAEGLVMIPPSKPVLFVRYSRVSRFRRWPPAASALAARPRR
ncbi:sugar-specific transcriptional regulator TrmB [Kibdelosporangium banguiense]|uniref:Sugar-specific transcriptional regulator TrmB n=1 Tax=Kibdelosporangium banguiense TaxID=1365924 RepID=A0ABS4TYS0_9PSEU|nr:hypothetical protein [Kibdelosporangium banguiense]MBP2329554.1 sugar-specific transcriptional regulator TrmB [Kibdelosporangium banguiense]